MSKEELITTVLKRLGYENIEQGTKRSNTSKETTNVAASDAGDGGSATEQPLKESKQASKENGIQKLNYLHSLEYSYSFYHYADIVYI